MVGIKNLSDKKKKPLFPQTARINSLLAIEGNAETLFDVFTPTPNHLTDSLETVVNKTITANVQLEELVDGFPTHNTIKKGISRFTLHLTTGIVFQDMGFCPDTQQERILAEGEFAFSRFPVFKVRNEVGVVNH
ncbi:hypothetical protein HG531_006167 [Fusarium graminearum]|nr:hypothetical protein HG531_006167 [Fusarium graminearum]